MKFLILTITAGHGHNQTANSLCDYIKSTGNNALVLDALEYINPVLKESVSRGYLISTTISPYAYGKFYRLAEKKEKNDSKFSPQKITTTILSKRILQFIKEYAPNVIICTHVMSAQLISALKDHGLGIPTYGIITDYTVHPYWDETNIDYYLLANELLIYQAVKKGIKNEKLLPLGIPINLKFALKGDKAAARESLKIENKPTVLLMSGSMGYGNIYKILLEICNIDIDLQVISVCGNNKAIKRKIDKHTFNKKVYNYGFTNQIDTFMDASDVIITKPGGLTISEALAKELPMILIKPIPGQEERNKEFLLNNGIAMAHSQTCMIDELLYQLLTNENRINIIKETIRTIKKPYATKELVNFIISKVNETNG